jgi:hypothetical protein
VLDQQVRQFGLEHPRTALRIPRIRFDHRRDPFDQLIELLRRITDEISHRVADAAQLSFVRRHAGDQQLSVYLQIAQSQRAEGCRQNATDVGVHGFHGDRSIGFDPQQRQCVRVQRDGDGSEPRHEMGERVQRHARNVQGRNGVLQPLGDVHVTRLGPRDGRLVARLLVPLLNIRHRLDVVLGISRLVGTVRFIPHERSERL